MWEMQDLHAYLPDLRVLGVEREGGERQLERQEVSVDTIRWPQARSWWEVLEQTIMGGGVI
jgi:hypothetical protein